MDEHLTRGIPIQPDETRWARHRPAQHRVRTPQVGDTVLYRHSDWAEPTEAEVLWVQPVDDLDDPNVCAVQTDEAGSVVVVEGRPVVAVHADPWPTLRLKTRFGLVVTREARLRGSPGWLPPDWQRRYRPVPAVTSPLVRTDGPAPAPEGR